MSGWFGPLLERLEQQVARLLVLALGGVDAAEREVAVLVALVLGDRVHFRERFVEPPEQHEALRDAHARLEASGFCCR